MGSAWTSPAGSTARPPYLAAPHVLHVHGVLGTLALLLLVLLLLAAALLADAEAAGEQQKARDHGDGDQCPGGYCPWGDGVSGARRAAHSPQSKPRRALPIMTHPVLPPTPSPPSRGPSQTLLRRDWLTWRMGRPLSDLMGVGAAFVCSAERAELLGDLGGHGAAPPTSGPWVSPHHLH